MEERREDAAARMRRIREELFEGSNTKFAEALGIAPNTMSAMCTGNYQLGPKSLGKIAERIPEINQHWLLTGLGRMKMSDPPTIEDVLYDAATRSSSPDVKSLIDTIESQQKTIELLQQTIDRLEKSIKQSNDMLNAQFGTVEKQSDIIDKLTLQITQLINLSSSQHLAHNRVVM